MKLWLSTKWLITKFHWLIYRHLITPVRALTHTPEPSLWSPLSTRNDWSWSQGSGGVVLFFLSDWNTHIISFSHLFVQHNSLLWPLFEFSHLDYLYFWSQVLDGARILWRWWSCKIFLPQTLSLARFVFLWFSLLGMFIPHSFNKHWLTTYCVPGMVLDVVNWVINRTDMAPAFTGSTDQWL